MRRLIIASNLISSCLTSDLALASNAASCCENSDFKAAANFDSVLVVNIHSAAAAKITTKHWVKVITSLH